MESRNGISTEESGNIIAAGPDGVRAYTILAARRYALMEIRSGMKLSGKMSTLAALKMQGFVPESCRTLREAYPILDRLAASLPGQTSVPLDGE